MRKMIIALALASMSSAAMAQDSNVPEMKYSVSTNSFWSNWFISVGGDYSAAYSDQEYKQGLSVSPFKKYRGSWGGHVAVGKWFTPGIGVRVNFAGLQIKQVNDDQKNSRDFGYMAPEAMFNLSNLLCGYNSTRVWNFIVYGGVAGSRDFSDDTYSFAPIAGVMSTWRLSKRVNFNLEMYGMIGEDNMDGWDYRDKFGSRRPNRKGWGGHDRLWGASAGFTVNLGKCTWDKTADVDALMAMNQSQIDGLNGQINDLRGKLNAALQDNSSLKQQLQDCQNRKPEQVVQVEKKNELESIVTFRQGKSVIDLSQQPNVERVATYMRNHKDSKVVIEGYASPEGPQDLNERLAEARAQAVKTMLIKKYRISESRISAKGRGIGNMFSEPDWNRVSISTINN